MSQNSERMGQNSPVIEPDVGSCYKNGWRQLWKYILELLLIIIISFVISIPSYGMSAAQYMGDIEAVFLWFFALAYTILIFWPIEYGVSFAYLKAARGDRLEVKDMFDVFQNYLNAILAHLLVTVIIAIGIVLLIIPGIIFACKLAFVPYLIVERKMEAIAAVKESWRMTRGYAAEVFAIGLLAIPIAIAGLLCFGVGIIIAIMWIGLAFASLYHAVSISRAASEQERGPTQ